MKSTAILLKVFWFFVNVACFIVLVRCTWVSWKENNNTILNAHICLSIFNGRMTVISCSCIIEWPLTPFSWAGIWSPVSSPHSRPPEREQVEGPNRWWLSLWFHRKKPPTLTVTSSPLITSAHEGCCHFLLFRWAYLFKDVWRNSSWTLSGNMLLKAVWFHTSLLLNCLFQVGLHRHGLIVDACYIKYCYFNPSGGLSK